MCTVQRLQFTTRRSRIGRGNPEGLPSPSRLPTLRVARSTIVRGAGGTRGRNGVGPPHTPSALQAHTRGEYFSSFSAPACAGSAGSRLQRGSAPVGCRGGRDGVSRRLTPLFRRGARVDASRRHARQAVGARACVAPCRPRVDYACGRLREHRREHLIARRGVVSNLVVHWKKNSSTPTTSSRLPCRRLGGMVGMLMNPTVRERRGPHLRHAYTFFVHCGALVFVAAFSFRIGLSTR